VELDGQSISLQPGSMEQPRLWFTRTEDKWAQTGMPGRNLKGPRRNGPFKEAFNHRMIFVYGTAGSPEENAWSLAKARYDAETWYYRGNGAVDIIADREFKASTSRDRSVVLYGNAENNSAWSSLLDASPVQVHRDSVQIGSRQLSGEDLACIFCRPRPDSDQAMVAVVSGTGAAGLRLTDRLPYFISGVAFPDCTVLGSDSLKDGDGGLRACGYFGNDWSVESGQFAWRE
jgi:hypothetical protein